MEAILNLAIGTGILALLVILWALLAHRLTPHVRKPDGKARLTGSCGDTMEIHLRFKEDRVVESSYWTDGCVYSLNCVCAAAELAKGKTPDEILEIDTDLLQRSVGWLPRDQMHCARLSIETLCAAVDDYMLKPKGRSGA